MTLAVLVLMENASFMLVINNTEFVAPSSWVRLLPSPPCFCLPTFFVQVKILFFFSKKTSQISFYRRFAGNESKSIFIVRLCI